jgi:hypothetical protein
MIDIKEVMQAANIIARLLNRALNYLHAAIRLTIRDLHAHQAVRLEDALRVAELDLS